MSDIFFLTALFTASLEVSTLFGPNYQQRDIRLFSEQNSHQLDFVAHHIQLCFQARMSDESLLAPHVCTPQTVSYKMKKNKMTYVGFSYNSNGSC